MGWLINNKNVSLIILEAGNPRPSVSDGIPHRQGHRKVVWGLPWVRLQISDGKLTHLFYSQNTPSLCRNLELILNKGRWDSTPNTINNTHIHRSFIGARHGTTILGTILCTLATWFHLIFTTATRDRYYYSCFIDKKTGAQNSEVLIICPPKWKKAGNKPRLSPLQMLWVAQHTWVLSHKCKIRTVGAWGRLSSGSDGSGEALCGK